MYILSQHWGCFSGALLSVQGQSKLTVVSCQNSETKNSNLMWSNKKLGIRSIERTQTNF